MLKTMHVILFVIFLLQAAVFASGYTVRNWSTENGFPHGRVNCILQSASGYLWIGTENGLVRFDGLHMQIYSAHNNTLPASEILSLYQDPDSVLWIGTGGAGVYSVKNEFRPSFLKSPALPNGHITAITSDFEGNLWLGTQNGLYRIGEQGQRRFGTEDGLLDAIITCLDTDINGNIWAGTLRGGIAKLRSKVIRTYAYREDLTEMAVRAVKADNRGRVYAGTINGMYILEPGYELFYRSKGSAFLPVSGLALNAEGSLWLATMTDGPGRYAQSKLELLSENLPEISNYLTCATVENGGSIWFGSEANGLFQLRPRLIDVMPTGIPEPAITAIVQLSDSRMLIGTRGDGLYIGGDAEGKVKKIDGLERPTAQRIRFLYRADNRKIYIATDAPGLFTLNKNQALPVRLPKPLASKQISDMLITGPQTWLATAEGLFELSPSGRAKIRLKGKRINRILSPHPGVLWLATGKGLFQLKGETLLRIGNSCDVRDLCIVQDSLLLLTTHSQGLGLVRADSICWISKNSLPDNNFAAIFADRDGDIWLGSARGVFRIRLQNVLEMLSGSRTRLPWTWLRQSDGLPAENCNYKGHPLFVQTEEGRILVATGKGIGIIPPNLSPHSSPKPATHIEEIAGADQLVSIQNTIAVKTSRLPLQITLTAFDYTNPQAISFEGHLSGPVQEEFQVRAGQPRQLTLKDLPAGQYNLKVGAIDNGSLEAGPPALINLSIQLPFYKQAYFYLFLTLLAGLGYPTVRIIRRQKKQRRTQRKYQTSALQTEQADAVWVALNRLMGEEKLYLDGELTLKSLAARLHIHYNHLSQIINSKSGQSFNDFINSFRISEAQRLLADPTNARRTILELMLECGFYSKSVFNTAFKKHTGQTPSQYRQSQKL